MKKIVLANEMAQAVISKIEAFKTEKNKLQLTIGVNNMGDGLACFAVIVNGGMMAQIGFKTTGVPKDCENFSEDAPYFTVCVSAAQFCSYLKAFLAFGSDIGLEYDEKSTLSIKVGTQAKVSLEVSSEMDALLPTSLKGIFAKVKVSTDKFLNALKVGGFTSSAAVDDRGITDRVAIKFNGEAVTVYSTDGQIMSKAWTECVSKFNKPARCAAFLNEKLAGLDEATKATFIEKIKAVQTNAEETVKLAEAEGYEDGALSITLPTASANVLRSVFFGTEELLITVSGSHIMVQAGNVLATFCLGGKVSGVYTSTVDPWEKTEWTSQVVLDKEAFVNALSIIRLGVSADGGKKNSLPFHSSSKGEKLVLKDSRANVVSLPLVANSGDLSKIGIYLDVEKVITILSKLSNGNVVARYYVAPNGKTSYPVCFSNGDLEGKGTSSYTYLLPVNVKSNATNAAGDKPSQEEKAENADKAKKAETKVKEEAPKQSSRDASNDVVNEEEIPDLPEESLDEFMS